MPLKPCTVAAIGYAADSSVAALWQLRPTEESSSRPARHDLQILAPCMRRMSDADMCARQLPLEARIIRSAAAAMPPEAGLQPLPGPAVHTLPLQGHFWLPCGSCACRRLAAASLAAACGFKHRA